MCVWWCCCCCCCCVLNSDFHLHNHNEIVLHSIWRRVRHFASQSGRHAANDGNGKLVIDWSRVGFSLTPSHRCGGRAFGYAWPVEVNHSMNFDDLCRGNMIFIVLCRWTKCSLPLLRANCNGRVYDAMIYIYIVVGEPYGSLLACAQCTATNDGWCSIIKLRMMRMVVDWNVPCLATLERILQMLVHVHCCQHAMSDMAALWLYIFIFYERSMQ